MKLYQLTNQNKDLENLLSQDEITEEDFQDNKEMLLELIQDKASDLILVNQSFESDIASVDNLIKLLQDKKKKLQTKQENFNNYVMFNMKQLELKEVKTSIGKIQVKEYTKTTVNEDLLGTDAYDIVYKVKTQKELKELGYEKALVETVTEKLYVK